VKEGLERESRWYRKAGGEVPYLSNEGHTMTSAAVSTSQLEFCDTIFS